MRFRVFPPHPFRPLVAVAGHAFCSACRDWKPFDIKPGIPEYDIPPVVVCVRCGGSVDYQLEEEAS